MLSICHDPCIIYLLIALWLMCGILATFFAYSPDFMADNIFESIGYHIGCLGVVLLGPISLFILFLMR